MTLRCPICKKEIVWEGNAHRPFCSDHCQKVDLGRWLHEEYAVGQETGPGAESSRTGNNPAKS